MQEKLPPARPPAPPAIDDFPEPRAVAVEEFMRAMSQGVGMCLAARSAGVRVTNERKRKAPPAADEEEAEEEESDSESD